MNLHLYCFTLLVASLPALGIPASAHGHQGRKLAPESVSNLAHDLLVGAPSADTDEDDGYGSYGYYGAYGEYDEYQFSSTTSSPLPKTGPPPEIPTASTSTTTETKSSSVLFVTVPMASTEPATSSITAMSTTRRPAVPSPPFQDDCLYYWCSRCSSRLIEYMARLALCGYLELKPVIPSKGGCLS